ncbi:MAG: Asp-tRNA(Asn)/Glu-tRNA(Gln) amidotransferase subunit GatC [Acidimicrobiales bacterium]|nr:Asp-tRNA(Asn)/Glu-tRNA(Gln) amidotransferase subunit GatC [Acidimicrobiales bacterium]
MPDATPRGDADPITRDEVAHIAKLSMLDLSDEQLDLFTGQLAAVLEHAQDVEALDVHDVEPTHHPFGLVNVARADVVVPSLDRSEVLAQAPDVEDGRFRVPPALGEQP